MARHLIVAALVGAVVLSSCGAGTSSDVTPQATQGPPENLPPLERPPLDPPIRITATFGEYRRGHFHAGVDFSTEHRVGRPVYAPVNGYVERVRTSGAGFGRSLMLRTPDGRTILLAHLDAFDEPIASFVAAVQDSSGEYEQELTPPPNALPVRAGQRIAWSGDSGAGPPHLHMEVRFGDLAYNPLRHGLAVADVFPPVLRRVILEPVDDVSYVQGSSAPRSIALPADTVVVEGRVRVWIEAADGVTDRWPRAAPYAASMEWRGVSVECRFDRIAWDDDMSAVEWVYDARGSVSPRHPLALWSAPEFRPSMLAASGDKAGAGVIAVEVGDPPQALTLAVRDAADNRTVRRVILRPPRADERERMAARARAGSAGRTRRAAARPGFELIPVQGPFVRIRYSGITRGSRDLALGFAGESLTTRPADFASGRWSAVVRVPPAVTAILAAGSRADDRWEVRRPVRLLALSPESTCVVTATEAGASYRWSFPRNAAFAPTFLTYDSLAPSRASPGLKPVSSVMELEPSGWPLRRPAQVEVVMHDRDHGHAALFVQRSGAWIPARGESVTSAPSGERVEGLAVVLGRVAAFDDVAAPRAGIARVVRLRTGAPNRWALQCAVIERGSGVDASRTHLMVDGRQVPSEWNAERGVLRWRPLHPPPRGAHRYEVVVTDRAGLESRGSGGFVAR